MKKLILLILVLSLLSFGGLAAAQDATFRVAIVMPSSTTDLSWSQAIYQGLLEVQGAGVRRSRKGAVALEMRRS